MTKEGFLGQCHPLCQILIGKTRGRRDLAWLTPLRHQHGCYNLIGCSPKRSMKIPCTRNRSNRPHGKAPTIGPPSSHSDVSPASWFFFRVICAMLRLGMRDTTGDPQCIAFYGDDRYRWQESDNKTFCF